MNIGELFETKKRDNGEDFVCLKDQWSDTPIQDWIRDSVHNGIFPNDFAYELARCVASHALDLLDTEDLDERSDLASQVADDIASNYSDRHSISNWIRHCDGLDLLEEYVGEGLILPEADARGQIIQGIYWHVLRCLESFPISALTQSQAA